MKKEYEATNYESDLTDEQWEEIKEFFPSGNKSKYHKRSLVEKAKEITSQLLALEEKHELRLNIVEYQ